ncbi:MAG TPA: hypothetical protein VGA95_03885 [Thermodesulfobacteriota bacterium]
MKKILLKILSSKYLAFTICEGQSHEAISFLTLLPMLFSTIVRVDCFAVLKSKEGIDHGLVVFTIR